MKLIDRERRVSGVMGAMSRYVGPTAFISSFFFFFCVVSGQELFLNRDTFILMEASFMIAVWHPIVAYQHREV